MPVHIGSTKFNDEWRPAQNLNFLRALIGEKVIVTTEFYYENIKIALVDDAIICHPDAADVGTLTNRQELVYSPDDPAAFSEYNVGDSMKVAGSAAGNNGTFIITEIISSALVRVAGATFVNEVLPYGAGAYIANVTPFNGVKYAYNILQGAPNYNSLIDGELQQLKYPTADATVTGAQPMFFNGILSYQIGSALIQGVSFTNERQTFKITHTTFITPWFLASQFNALLLGIPPASYAAGNCPNYVYKLELLRALSNPTSIQVLSVNNPANVGWFNENYNGNPTNYSISLFEIRKADTTLIPQLIFDEVLDLKIRVSNTTNTPFSNNNTKFCIHFIYLPESETLYQNNGRNLTQNFVFDRKFATVGAAAGNGDNFGTGYQVLKDISGTFVSTSVIEILAKVDLGADAKARLQQGDFSRYMIWVTTENHSLADLLSDRVALPVQISEFFVRTTVSDLITCKTNYIQHPFIDDSDEIVDNVEVFPVDDIAARCKFFIDLASYPDDGIKIKTIRPKLLLRKTGSPDIILDDMVINTAGFPYVGLAQDINFTMDRIFQIPSGDIRKTVTIARDYAADVDNGFTNWYINWPFMVRWAYYIALLNLPNPIPTDLVDTSLGAAKFNGMNEFWHRFTTLAGWSLKFEIDFTFEQKGDTAIQSFTSTLNSYDFEGGPSYAANSIKFYDNDDNTELISGGIKRIQGWKSTRIEAVFNKIAPQFPALANVIIVIWIEPYEAGGVPIARPICSKYVWNQHGWLLSTDGSDKVVVTNPNPGEYKGVALINHAVIPASPKFRFYARLYDDTQRPCLLLVLDATAGSSDDQLMLQIRITSGAVIIDWDDDEGNTTIVNSGPGLQNIFMPNAAPLSVRNITICGNVENISSFDAKMNPNLGPVSKFITAINMTRLESDLIDYNILSISSSKVGDGDLIFPVSTKNFVLLRFRGSDFAVLTAPYNTTLTTLNLSTLSGDTLSIDIERMNALTTVVFNALMNCSSSFIALNNEALNQVFNFGTDMFPTTINYRCVAPVTSPITQATLDSIIDNIYQNRVAYSAANAGVKTLTISGTNPAPGGTLVAPAGYVQADGVTVGNDGTPANAKEQAYVLINQNIDLTTNKKYNWLVNMN